MPVDTDRLRAAADALRQEILRDRVERQRVLRPREAMAFIREQHVGHGQVLRMHRGDALVRLGLLDARVVGALSDQERSPDRIDASQR